MRFDDSQASGRKFVAMILVPGETCGARCQADDSGLLIDAQDFYQAIYRVAPLAKRYLAFCGWQFDSDVPLLHGDRAANTELPVNFLPFLKELLDRNRELDVYVLAWDFNPIYLFEREWFQEWRFTWNVSNRMHFVLDRTHPIGASHHQKLVLVDGNLAYLGGMDICDHRWDDREHRAANEDRVTTDGRSYGPYHDVQAYVTGPAAQRLVKLFQQRWRLATGDPLELPAVDVRHETAATLRVGPASVGISETRGAMADVPVPGCDHVAAKYERAIASAKRLIYIENQYFTADRIFAALMARLRPPATKPLDVVFVLPRKPSAFKEMMALGIRQCKLLQALEKTAERSGHRLGVYYSSPTDRIEDATYIHSKILVVDDTFLSVGSANTTNRSLGIDSELDVAWEGEGVEERIREVRLSLLREHAGSDDVDPRTDGAVQELNRVCDSADTKLYRLPYDDYGPLGGILPDTEIPDFAIDPESPLVVEALQSLELEEGRHAFTKGIRWLRTHLPGKE